MDPCISNTNINNARSVVRSRLGVPKRYAKNLSRKQICAAMKRCKNPNSFPPAKIDIAGEYIYLIDPDSPLNAKDYSTLFEGGKKPAIISLAKKLGLVDTNKTSNELKANIMNLLEDLKLREPIKAMKIPQLIKNVNANNNLGLGIPSNNNNRRNNLGLGIPSNNNGKMNNFGMKTNNGIQAPGISRQLPGGRVETFNKQNENKAGFFPGRPKPSTLIPTGVSGKTTPTIGGTTTNVNSKALIKRLSAIKDQLGVFSSLNAGVPPPRGVPPSTFGGSIAPSSQSQPMVQHFHMPGTPSSAFGGSTAPSNFSGI